MGSWKKPDPELLPVQRPLCPKCQKRMTTTAVSDGPEGFEHRKFECLKCSVTEVRTLASDPLKSDALRWLSGELALQLPFPKISESMGNHDSKIVDAGSVD